MKTHPMEAPLFHADVQTYTHNETNSHFLHFYEPT